jgi:DNA-binding transcriptional LysR family regulator
VELRHLRYFVAVAEWKGFSHAARRLYISQSAISEQIADLEREIGVQLLHRNRRQVALTDEGKVFLDEARKLLSSADHAVQMAQRSMRGEVGTLRIGFFTNGIGVFFSRLIREFRVSHPDVKLSLFEMSSRPQMDALANNEIDIAFTRQLDPQFATVLASELLFEEPIVAVLPFDHPLAGGPVELHMLAPERFVLIDREIWPTLFDSIITLCSSAGFSPQIANTAARWPAVLALVEAGEGVGLVTAGVQRFRFSGVSFCQLTPTRSIGVTLAWRTNEKSRIVEAFLNLVRNRKERIRGSQDGPDQ